WHGSADSAVDISPAGFTFSTATGISANIVVGCGKGAPTGNSNHALLWATNTGTYVDLNPVGMDPVASFALGAWGNSQVGNWERRGESHAALWNGTAESMVDLNPHGITNCSADAVAGDIQVGYCRVARSGGPEARLWHGAADSIIDLHASASVLIPSALWSSAHGVDLYGNVVGNVVDNQYNAH